MQIQHNQKDTTGTFYVEENGDRVAEMLYSQQENGPMIIEHTEVDQKLRGKKVGQELVTRAVEYAREKNYKITPVCSYAKAIFKRQPDFKDVLA